MDAHVREVVREMTRASSEERIVFPEMVRNLVAAGVERYQADLVRGLRIYYMPDGNCEVVEAHAQSQPASIFSAEAVERALRAVQSGEIRYREFCERIAAAGCVGYFVSIVGRRALYYGRTNDYLVECFPGAK